MSGNCRALPLRGNARYANNRDGYVADSPLHLALRELRADFTNRNGLIALAGVGVLLGISGPFQTFDLLHFMPRTLYWLIVTYVTYGMGAFINMYLQYRFGGALDPLPKRVVICGAATAFGVTLALMLINTLFFGWFFDSFTGFLTFFGFIVVICMVIVMLLTLLSPLPDVAPQTPALLDRLPLDKRGALMAVSVQDHYVSVTTTKGSEMLLMRLSDAIKETAPVAGLQVHRSHWVAVGQVAKAERIGDRAVLTLTNGAEVPASRSYIPALRDAGLLPKVPNG